MRYSVFDKNHDFIGIVTADSEEEALRIAKNTIPYADSVEERSEGHHQSGAQ